VCLGVERNRAGAGIYPACWQYASGRNSGHGSAWISEHEKAPARGLAGGKSGAGRLEAIAELTSLHQHCSAPAFTVTDQKYRETIAALEEQAGE
jgi:hypothetical protein